MPHQPAPTTVFSPWLKEYAAAGDARLMATPNTALPRSESAPPPQPTPVVTAAPTAA